jgi:ABC-type nitrate/sulfonate/bicarbonate transport system permease component
MAAREWSRLMKSPRNSILVAAEIAVPVVLLAVLWIITEHSRSFYVPPLSAILEEFVRLVSTRLASDVLPSLVRLFAGFSIGVAVGVTAGTTFGLFRNVRELILPSVEFFRAIPATLLVPFAITTMGVGDGMKVFIIALACFFPVLLNTISGIASLDPVLLDTARSYHVSGFDWISKFILPTAMPQIVTSMRTSLALGLVLMVISEMVASTNGLGYLVLHAQRTFSIPQMWAGILFIGLLGYVLNWMFVLVERRILAWHFGLHRRSHT